MLNEKLYQSIPNKNEEITCWEELIEHYEKNTKPIFWIFRGQEKQDDPIFISGLERAAKNFVTEKNYQSSVREFENKLLTEFKRKLHHHTNTIPKEDDYLEHLALMQHYGAPTRLLDWTYSFFVALYFALEKTIYIERKNDNVECEVWALNCNWFTASKNVLPNFKEITNDKEKRIEKQKAIISYLINRPQPLVYPVNPFKLNDRLVIQQGIFLFPGDISKPFDDNLGIDKYSSESKDNLLRFKIKLDVKGRNEIFLLLHRMNINRATLFPGLAGFAESLKIKLAFPETLEDK